MRIYVGRLGKFLSVDPISMEYPELSPYQFASNTPIWAIDIDGLEAYLVQDLTLKNSKGHTFIYKVLWYELSETYLPRNYVTQLISTDYSNLDNSKTVLNYVVNRNTLKSKLPISPLPNNAVMQAIESDKANSNTHLVYISPTIYLGDDEGNTLDKLRNKMITGGNLGEIDNIASVLVNDPNSKVTITGSANPTPTNIDGAKSTKTLAHNIELAGQRANAGKSLLAEVLSNNYNKSESQIEILMQRVTTNSTVTEYIKDKNRNVSYKVE